MEAGWDTCKHAKECGSAGGAGLLLATRGQAHDIFWLCAHSQQKRRWLERLAAHTKRRCGSLEFVFVVDNDEQTNKVRKGVGPKRTGANECERMVGQGWTAE